MFYNYDIDKVLRENLDISDRATRKYLVSLDEDDKSAVATALAAALYDKIVKNVDKIDFGSIPKSMGDITKIDGYNNTIECLDIIKKLVIEYKESTEVADTVINAVENIKARKSTFMKAFATKSSLPMNLYNLIVLSIEHSVSFLISVCIEYIKNPDTKSIDIALDKAAYNNAHDNLLFEQLRVFNKSCGSGELDSCFAEVLKAKPVKEDVYVSAEEIPTQDVPDEDIPQYIPDEDSDGSELFRGEFDDNEPVNIQPVIPEDKDEDIECEDVFDLYDDDDEDDQEEIEYDDIEEDEPEVGYDFEEDEVKPSFDTPVVTNEIAITLTNVGIAAAIGLLGGAAILKGSVYIVKVLIPKMRNITYFFIHTRVKISDSLSVQAQLVELNAYNVKYDDNIDPKKRDKIVAKQLKIADNLKKWSNKFAIDNKKAEKGAKDDAKNDDKTKIEDIQDNSPDGGGDVLF